MKKQLYFWLACILFVNCEKEVEAPDLWVDHGGYELNEIIDIQLTPSIQDSSFTFNEVIPIKGTISATINLHGYSIRLTSKNSEKLLFSKDHHTHGNTLVLDYSWKNTIDHADTLVLSIVAHANHSGGRKEKEVLIFTQSHP